MASGDRLANLYAQNALPPGTLFATQNIRVGGSTPNESFPTLDFDDTTVEYADWLVRMPPNYTNGGITCSIQWLAASATSGNGGFSMAIRRIEPSTDDLDASHTYDYNDSAAVATPGTNGQTVLSSITFTNGADMDGWVAGEFAVVRIKRNTSIASDLTGDIQLLNVIINET